MLVQNFEALTEDERMWKNYVNDLPYYYRFIFNLSWGEPKDPFLVNVRDSIMATHVIRLKEQVYAGKKIILWDTL